MKPILKTILITIMLFFAAPAFAGGGQDSVNTWWDNQYKNNIAPQQRATVEEHQEERCDKKIKHYTQLVRDNPNNKYTRWQLRKWQKRCAE